MLIKSNIFRLLYFVYSAKDLSHVRRRLSVMSDSNLVEGIDNVSLETAGVTPDSKGEVENDSSSISVH